MHMNCPKCGVENSTGGNFCISCGSPLRAGESTESGGSRQSDVETLQKKASFLEGEVNRISLDLASLKEGLQGLRGDTLASPRSPRARGNLKKGWKSDFHSAFNGISIEQVLGGNWLAKVGVLALVIGVAFFLRLAFDNNWIGQTGQAVLGLVGGLVLLGAGEYWRGRYPVYAHALSGGGVAILYLSIFAASVAFGIIPFYPAIGFVLLVSMASAGLALRYESMPLAIIGILGAFMAPFILYDEVGVGVASRWPAPLVYLLAVDLGVLVLSLFRNWRWCTLLALLGSLMIFGAWLGDFGDSVGVLISQGVLTVIFLLFAGATTFFHAIWRRVPKLMDQFIMGINAWAYLGFSYNLLWEDLRPWMGGFTLLLALFYGGLGYAVLRRSAENVRLSFLALGISAVFVSIAIPVQFDAWSAWTSIAWAAQGTIMVWLSFKLRQPQLRLLGYVVLAIMVLSLLAQDVDLVGFRPILNERFLSYLAGITGLYVIALLARQNREILLMREQMVWCVYPVALASASLLSLLILSLEVWSAFDSRILSLEAVELYGSTADALRNAQNLSITALWALYSVTMLVVGIARRLYRVRLAALALLALPVCKLFVFDIFALDLAYRVVAFIGLGALLVASGYIYQRYSAAIREFLLEK